MFRKLIAITEESSEMNLIHKVDGRERYVLELLLFGYAYASRYILLNSKKTVERYRMRDPEILDKILKGGSSLGRVLSEKHLEYNDAEKCMYVDIDKSVKT